MLNETIYKNIFNTDVAMFPLSIKKTIDGDLLIKCRWINITNPYGMFDCGITDTIHIKASKLKDWKKIQYIPVTK